MEIKHAFCYFLKITNYACVAIYVERRRTTHLDGSDGRNEDSARTSGTTSTAWWWQCVDVDKRMIMIRSYSITRHHHLINAAAAAVHNKSIYTWRPSPPLDREIRAYSTEIASASCFLFLYRRIWHLFIQFCICIKFLPKMWKLFHFFIFVVLYVFNVLLFLQRFYYAER